MKAIGIVRKVDHLGRIVIPIEIRRAFEIEYLDPMGIYVEKDRIILRKYTPGCIFCGNSDNVVDFKGNLVCEECIATIAAKLL